jgi:hypothetical protein
LNQKHAKWVEFMQNFTFVINHIYGTANKVVDALSRKCLILQEFRVKTLGFDSLKDMYRDDSDFKDAYEACENLVLRDRSQWIEYLIQDGLLFKGNQLCIPKSSMRENLLKEKHSGGLAGHFGHDKTFVQLNNLYYWPGMRTMSRNLSTNVEFSSTQREKTEYRIVSTISSTREAVGRGKHGFCVRTVEDTREVVIPYSW